MKQQTKQESYIKRKPLKGGQINRQVKFITKPNQVTSITSATDIKTLKSKIKQNQSIQNVSLIEGSSFISNKQDGSMDSMDKMIIGVTSMGIDQKQFQDQSSNQQKSKASVTDLDFIEIHRQYEKLIGRNQLLGEQQSEEVSDQIAENSRVLPDQDDWQIKQLLALQKKLSLSLSPKKRQISNHEIKLHILKIQANIQQMKPKKSQDISNNSIKILVGNLGNLSQIHEEKQHIMNNSVDIQHKRNNQQDQQQFIDFVRQPDPHQNTENNQKKNYFPLQNQVNQWQPSPMFQNLQLQLQKQKESKKNQKSANYQQILQALNSKQQQQNSLQNLQFIIKRENWIKSHPTKSQNWKRKQLKLLMKMKKIIKNPQYDSQDSQQ